MPITKRTVLIAGEGYREVEEWSPPSDIFSAAYTNDGDGGDHLDLESARNIFRNLIRACRNFSKADIAVAIAEDNGDKPAEKAARISRQKLRDLTSDSRIETAQSIEDLRTIWPSELLGNVPF